MQDGLLVIFIFGSDACTGPPHSRFATRTNPRRNVPLVNDAAAGRKLFPACFCNVLCKVKRGRSASPHGTRHAGFGWHQWASFALICLLKVLAHSIVRML